MKILLVSGHTSGYNACKATGVNEGDLNIELVKKLKSLLEKYAEVTVYPYERDMYRDNKAGCCKVNMSSFKYIFEVHFNAFNGSAKGSSVQIHTDYKGGISVEQKIIDNIAAFGFKKRGANGIVRRNTLLNMQLALNKGINYAMLETCFYDNASDMALYKANKDKIAEAIAKGIIEGYGLAKAETKEEAKETDKAETKVKPFRVRVIDPELNYRAGAGTEHKINGVIRDKGTYTIVAITKSSDNNTWGKLKSGAGWINIEKKFVTVIDVVELEADFVAFKVKVTAGALNRRAGAGTEHKIIGVIKDKGIYTIVDVKKSADGGTWGKLNGGAGWINISERYVSRL